MLIISVVIITIIIITYLLSPSRDYIIITSRLSIEIIIIIDQLYSRRRFIGGEGVWTGVWSYAGFGRTVIVWKRKQYI